MEIKKLIPVKVYPETPDQPGQEQTVYDDIPFDDEDDVNEISPKEYRTVINRIEDPNDTDDSIFPRVITDTP
ncbi:hypothetical protein ELZ88_24860 (plasmid) [Salmonella enterica subsp. enterica serovar Karamoja]|uniref:Uncharacterized protein n=1 Tax=Salmonella enterica subsp. enterica serovar Karamoja TaxID=2500153 RepID=A0A3Q9MT42_SALET|nr:hypothetical protein [Salmonella enterica]AZT39750.1 hypothetical protein ELZ88_24860 [Salmonella enterica subsp. enterica serovar Karamoja]AZT44347.1 hypothetical protein EL007_24105 [Salmonella enterica subsp. enterica serovar Karamoja]